MDQRTKATLWVIAGAVLVIALVAHHNITKQELIIFCVVVPSIILHEVSHGLVAYWCGDDTAKRAGRLSLNPIRHVSLFGTILLPILLIITTGYAFGWAKPVPISIGKLRHPRNQAVLVGLAGPVVNILLALAGGFAFRFATHDALGLLANPDTWPLGDEILFFIGYANVLVAVFNLIPIPPLDGSSVVERLLPASALPGYYRLRPMAMVLVILLVFWAPGVLDSLFSHALRIWEDIVL
jgi:Zn-dependent protease